MEVPRRNSTNVTFPDQSGDRYWRGSQAWRYDEASTRSEEHTSELQSLTNLVCRLLLEKKKKKTSPDHRKETQQPQKRARHHPTQLGPRQKTQPHDNAALSQTDYSQQANRHNRGSHPSP